MAPTLLAPLLSDGPAKGLKGKGKAVADGIRALKGRLTDRMRDPSRLALNLINDVIRGKSEGKDSKALGATPVLPREITINNYAYQESSYKDPQTQLGNVLANVEVSLDITGSVYQRLINGMAARAGSPALPAGATQVNANEIYTMQIGLSVYGATGIGASGEFAW